MPPLLNRSLSNDGDGGCAGARATGRSLHTRTGSTSAACGRACAGLLLFVRLCSMATQQPLLLLRFAFGYPYRPSIHSHVWSRSHMPPGSGWSEVFSSIVILWSLAVLARAPELPAGCWSGQSLPLCSCSFRVVASCQCECISLAPSEARCVSWSWGWGARVT
eukprot:scaffold7825_cov128-Isochrysis_galbana.AAC.1